MTYHHEQRRRFDEAPEPRPMPSSGMQWGIPIGLAAVVFVVGLIFYNMSHHRTATASNNTPTATQSTPSPNAGKTAPPPARTQ
jgi:hypothetical protein